jgi:hypothetical protein
MSNFHIKSVLLGIGIGIIITATISLVYLSGRDPMKELTEQQIVSQAEKYGMVRASVLQRETGATEVASNPAESASIFKSKDSGSK